MTQAELAEALDKQPSTITKLETGHGASLYLIAAIAAFFGFSLDELIPNREDTRATECFSATSDLSDEEFAIYQGAGRGAVIAYRKITQQKS